MANMKILTVSQLNIFARSIVDSDPFLSNVFLMGEISNFKNHYQSGHMYFSLKDEKATIKAVMFSYYTKNLKFLPQDGMKVIVRGKVSIYEATGTYQIYIEDMQPDGLGSLNLAFEQLKSKLEKEGLFNVENKKSLPKYPKKVGVITAKTGAAFFDIQNVLKRRFPLIEILFYPVLVQGKDSPREIIEAINYMNEFTDADVLIVGRGGGSIEDLWAFNDEKLARTIYASRIPIVSAVGHETDFTICDFVADLRAPTPSAAAELVSQDSQKLLSDILKKFNYMTELVKLKLSHYENHLTRLEKNEAIYKPVSLINKRKLKLDLLENKLLLNFSNLVNKSKGKFLSLVSKIDALSPLKLLNAGYSVATNKRNILIKSIKDVKYNDKINVRLKDGILNCLVCNVDYGNDLGE